MKASLLTLAIAIFAAVPAQAEGDQPLKVTGAEAVGPIFSSPKVILEDHKGVQAKWFEMLASQDKKFSAGVYEATASRSEIASYGENEFMYFLKGGVTLTSADGTVTEVKAGDGVTIPKGWKGVWDTKGYTKFYVTYDPDAGTVGK